MDPISNLKSRLDEADIWDKEINLERNQFLNVAGRKDRNLYFVKSGSLRIFIQPEEEELTIRFGYENNFIAALDSFISSEPSIYFIQALKKTVVKSIKHSDYMNFISSDHENQHLWQALMQGLVLQQMEREVDLLISSPQERYERVLKRSPQLFQEIPNKYIASYLRMTPETLSRLKKS